jgi:hypothetical protein
VTHTQGLTVARVYRSEMKGSINGQCQRLNRSASLRRDVKEMLTRAEKMTFSGEGQGDLLFQRLSWHGHFERFVMSTHLLHGFERVILQITDSS